MVVALLVAQIVEADEVPQCAEMIPGTLGEGQSLSHESGTALSQGQPEPLDVSGQTRVLAHSSVFGGWDHDLVRSEEVREHRDSGPVAAW